MLTLALKCLSEFNVSRGLKLEHKEAISALVSGNDLLAELLTGFWKSLIFQVLVRLKEIMTGNLSSVVVVCPRHLNIHLACGRAEILH